MRSENIKKAVISGASHALKFKDRNPRATEQETLQHVMDNLDEILGKIEESDED